MATTKKPVKNKTVKAKVAPKVKKPVKKIKKEFQGEVVSDKMDKTVTVLVSTIKLHPKYHKRYKVHKKYKVHDEKNKFKKGDKVSFKASKAYSKTKKWEVIY
jgi:small subunit ribosomal protein S17